MTRSVPRHAPSRSRAAGFTLVELLVVITIIGILMGLLLPAVQAARESARRTQCSNNLNQLGKAALNHETQQGFFPTGGWGYRWAGDPDQGAGLKQPGGFFFNILPYLEQQNLWATGAGATVAKKPALLAQTCATPLAIYTCPSRRSVAARPYTEGSPYINTAALTVTGKSDYAANGGGDADAFDGNLTDGPPSLPPPASYTWPTTISNTGVCYQRSMIKMAHITDGASSTLLAAEKSVDTDRYEDCRDPDDNDGWDMGYDNDVVRFGSEPPVQDAPGINATNGHATTIFGSPHSSGFGVVFCDGHVKVLSFSIDQKTLINLCDRADGKVIDDSQL